MVYELFVAELHAVTTHALRRPAGYGGRGEGVSRPAGRAAARPRLAAGVLGPARPSEDSSLRASRYRCPRWADYAARTALLACRRAEVLTTPRSRAGSRQDYAALLCYAWGWFSTAIGPLFADFDQGRRAPWPPRRPYHFMTRVIAVDGPLGGMQEGSAVTAEYDVPDQAWYFEQNVLGAMPFAMLMEIALQPCGWLAMYAGSVLGSPADPGVPQSRRDRDCPG